MPGDEDTLALKIKELSKIADEFEDRRDRSLDELDDKLERHRKELDSELKEPLSTLQKIASSG